MLPSHSRDLSDPMISNAPFHSSILIQINPSRAVISVIVFLHNVILEISCESPSTSLLSIMVDETNVALHNCAPQTHQKTLLFTLLSSWFSWMSIKNHQKKQYMVVSWVIAVTLVIIHFERWDFSNEHPPAIGRGTPIPTRSRASCTCLLAAFEPSATCRKKKNTGDAREQTAHGFQYIFLLNSTSGFHGSRIDDIATCSVCWEDFWSPETYLNHPKSTFFRRYLNIDNSVFQVTCLIEIDKPQINMKFHGLGVALLLQNVMVDPFPY